MHFQKSFFSLLCLFLYSHTSFAEIFGLPHFIAPQKMAIGIEPEVIFSNQLTPGSGAGVNLKGMYGLSPLSNIIATIGTGTGPKQFRWNTTFTFDFFPDWKNQPGIGLALGLGTTHTPKVLAWETMATFYIHKTLTYQPEGAKNPYLLEPFFAIPLGLWLSQSTYRVLTSLVVGSFFHYSEKSSAVIEFGLSTQNTNTYLSGGLLYYY